MSGYPSEAAERVLIIEDDPDYRRYLELRLQSSGCETRAAASGEAGLEALAAFEPCVVITDLMLPGVDGLTVCRRIRASEANRRLPILILSSADHSAEVGEVVGLGLIWYLRKGADWRLIEKTIHNLVARSREVSLAS